MWNLGKVVEDWNHHIEKENANCSLPMETTSKDLSSEELTSWLLSNFGEEPQQPEHPPQQLNMSSWLRPEGFDTSCVAVRELEGGLNGYGIILENVFTRHECQHIIGETERLGYGYLGAGKTGRAYRGNCCLQLDDTSNKLGQEIWRRISSFLPTKEDIPGEGRFEYLEVNTRYRFAKYFSGLCNPRGQAHYL